MITGWNEWIAGRWDRGSAGKVFVDQYDREYSRDIEPMKGGHLDAYYLQMIEGIRRYKGVPSLPKLEGKKAIDLNAGFEQWNSVEPTLVDWTGETAKRDFKGQGGTHYVNESGRNDFQTFKVSRDENNYYFYAKTREPIQQGKLDNLCLLIDADSNLKTGFCGGDYLIGRAYATNGASLERFAGKDGEVWNWKNAGKVEFKQEGEQIMIAVPYESLGLEKNASFSKISFKWLDNFSDPSSPADFYLTGDVAPESRFFFKVVE